MMRLTVTCVESIPTMIDPFCLEISAPQNFPLSEKSRKRIKRHSLLLPIVNMSFSGGKITRVENKILVITFSRAIVQAWNRRDVILSYDLSLFQGKVARCREFDSPVNRIKNKDRLQVVTATSSLNLFWIHPSATSLKGAILSGKVHWTRPRHLLWISDTLIVLRCQQESSRVEKSCTDNEIEIDGWEITRSENGNVMMVTMLHVKR